MKRKLLYAGGVIVVLAVAVGAYFYFKPASAERPRVLLAPDQKTVWIAGYEFGPYKTEHDEKGGIGTVYFERETPEWYYLNFYLPAYWPDENFTALDVADYLRASLESVLLYSFSTPGQVPGKDDYYLVLADENIASSSSNAYLMMISQVGDTPYASIYGRHFTGENPRNAAIAWIAEQSEKYIGEVANISPTEAWLDLFR